jgi:hypothetical protein
MTLQNFNVFGSGSVERNRLYLRYIYFPEVVRPVPVVIDSDEESPEIPSGQKAEFMFGLFVDLEQDKHYPRFHETEPFEDEKIFLPTLPVIVKHMDIIAGVVRETYRISPKA